MCVLRIAKLLRESIRRSIRQIRTMTTPMHTVTSLADLEVGVGAEHHLSVTAPPAYASVLMEMRCCTLDSGGGGGGGGGGGVDDVGPVSPDAVSERLSQLAVSQNDATTSSTDSTTSPSRLTAVEVTRLLRHSFRRGDSSSHDARAILRDKKEARTTSLEDDDDQDQDQQIQQASVVVILPNDNDESNA